MVIPHSAKLRNVQVQQPIHLVIEVLLVTTLIHNPTIIMCDVETTPHRVRAGCPLIRSAPFLVPTFTPIFQIEQTDASIQRGWQTHQPNARSKIANLVSTQGGRKVWYSSSL